VSVRCYSCGTPVEFPPGVEAALRGSGSTFYCHAGHPQHFTQGPTQAERDLAEERRHVAHLKREITYWTDATVDARNALRDARRTARTCPLCGEVFRTRRRLPEHLAQGHGARESATTLARALVGEVLRRRDSA
jgi:hypothetical protein